MPVTLTIEADGVAHLTLDRPSKRNALNGAMLVELRARIAEIRGRTDIRVVLLRGRGGTFCAGADISDWVAPPHQVAADLSQLGRDTFAELAALPVASVAVVDGTAVGGGLELALACDLRIAADNALLGFPELGLGNLPAWGGTARLVDVAGLGVTRHLLLSGELVSGERAAELFLVTSSHPVADLPTAVEKTVQRLLGAEPRAVSLAKSVLHQFDHDSGLEPALAAYTAGLDSSRTRKQDFLDRKAVARVAKAEPAAPASTKGTTP